MPIAVFLLFAAAGTSNIHKRAVDSFDRADFKRAAELLTQDLAKNAGTSLELDIRRMLVLALYNSGQSEPALDVYRTLVRIFPDFHFRDDEVLPDTIAFFDKHVPRTPASAPVVAAPIVAAPATQQAAPTLVKMPDAKQWHWYYLTPLGIGQFLAHSPVRGSLFLALQVAAIATNVAGGVLFGAAQNPDGKAHDAPGARRAQIMANVGFGAIIGSVLLGALDAALWE